MAKINMPPAVGAQGKNTTGHHYTTATGFSEVRLLAIGQWGRIHSGLGLSLKMTRKHGPCPGCGGNDRFRLAHDYPEHGRWLCGGGGDLQVGDGFALLGHVFGWSAAEQLAAVKRVLGIDTGLTATGRQVLRYKAEAYRRDMAAKAKAKDEAIQRDSDLLGATMDLDDAIRHRQYLSRQNNETLPPYGAELQAAQHLNSLLLEAYGGLM
ncbi:MAG: hypothetical protein KDI15_09925 [Thiothrix sp.]|nr:hypothetical protein [Thiothrix sp.]HPE62206.1 primase-helicase zinc-binding domain-containing protein [Thiolinea sp.]